MIVSFILFFGSFCIICHHYYFKYSHISSMWISSRLVSSSSLSLASFIHTVIVIIFHISLTSALTRHFYCFHFDMLSIQSYWLTQKKKKKHWLLVFILSVTENFCVYHMFLLLFVILSYYLWIFFPFYDFVKLPRRKKNEISFCFDNETTQIIPVNC